MQCPIPGSRDTRGEWKMKIAVASDHAGFSLKEEIAKVLKAQGHEIEDFGAYSEDAVDLPDQVYPAAWRWVRDAWSAAFSSMAWATAAQ